MSVDDRADQEVNGPVLASQIAARQRAAAAIPAGAPGDCEHCDAPSLRLVNKACAKCRDLYRLP